MIKTRLPRTTKSDERHVGRAAGIVAGAVVAANALLILLAMKDRGWGALGIAVTIAPITNAILLIASLACTPIVRRASGDAPTLTYTMVSVFLPILAVAADFLIILALPLHGC